jgi:predicted metal-dependent peptidase
MPSADPFAALEQAARWQVAEEQASKALATARSQLVLGKDAKAVFFATLALRLQPQRDWSLETMATDGRCLAYHPEFVLGLSREELQGVLAHEVMHNALQHHCRRGPRQPRRWNVACDLAVNPLLLHAGFQLPAGRLVPGEGPYHALAPGKSAEEYYDLLPPEGTDTEGGKAGDDPGGCGGVREPGDGSPAAARQAQAEWQVAVAQAAQIARQRGTLPAGLDRCVADVLQPQVDWRDMLRDFLSRHARNDYSWSPPHRRFVYAGLYLPGLRSEELGDVVLAVDTSGSIGPTELSRFADEAQGILDAYDCTLTVLYHDAAVQRVETWQPGDGPLTLHPVGGGGTSHIPVFDWIERGGMTPACVVCLTDLYTELPVIAPAYPVLWAVSGSNEQPPPFGLSVRLDR